MKKLIFKWSELKATFWFIPVIIIISSILLSIGLVYIDGSFNFSQDGIGRFFFVNSSDSARSILSTISAAMMGVAGTVFSITLVVLTLASSQFGPRLIKNFMYVRLNQVVLGSYISTYLYCLLVLIAVKDDNDYTFIPSISILVAIIAAITNIILLIVFIHQIAISLQADKVISDISDFIFKQLETLFPEKMGDVKKEENLDISTTISGYKQRIYIKAPKSGYLQYIDSEALIKIITKKDSLLELYPRPGRHLVQGGEIGLLYSNDLWEKEELETIFKQLEIGKIKTSQQDLEFSILQMVEIASRALSPGINDPFTAITSIDNLSATMCYLAQAQFPSKYRFDDGGTLRIIADTLEFEGVLDAAYNQIRQYSGGSPSVIIRLMDALTTISGFTTNEKHKKAVLKHAEMVLNIGKQTIKEEHDLEDLIKRSKKILN
ncbi:DUF2254 domain-containing protein [Confluentibacter flavum]|uniref:DUF2254 domain-containing protein n=1 Tax=Confluentibacter flavum TaxID=1909700 RepID=A0A2N3HIX4_9FLAO|nr:DUF2254 domain-containing protein [Confluentibacter flavum]PKQ44844.1 DUF2254 domain-containing protein [Confluentibacter flavum]